MATNIVLVHGWSVYNTNTYGELAARLKQEAQAGGISPINVVEVWLGKYISFRDEVCVSDLAIGFENALRDKLQNEFDNGSKFICITHSTGGPVVRQWWNQLYLKANKPCPMSHLIMLAPANFGSALAQLGKGRLSRIKSWFEGVEPGQGVLNWLELGSKEAWELNYDWIINTGDPSKDAGNEVFQFVLTGQTIDRSLYDNVNAYTGELGSDGVVRAAAANLNATCIELEQQEPGTDNDKFTILKLKSQKTSPKVAFALIKGRSHSGVDIGILRSIKNDGKPHPTIEAVLKCINTKNAADFENLCADFENQNKTVFSDERLEKRDGMFFEDRHFIHDRNSMIIFRFRDNRGLTITDYDLILTGLGGDPNKLPPGFFIDRQRNIRNPEFLTYFINYDIMAGCDPVMDGKKVLRPKRLPLTELGMIINARPSEGFVHYLQAQLQADVNNVENFIKPYQTILVDVVLNRVIHGGIFELTKKEPPEDFRDQPLGEIIK